MGDIVVEWRRGYRTRPPPMTDTHPHWPLISMDSRYRGLVVPESESLRDTADRVRWMGVVGRKGRQEAAEVFRERLGVVAVKKIPILDGKVVGKSFFFCFVSIDSSRFGFCLLFGRSVVRLTADKSVCVLRSDPLCGKKPPKSWNYSHFHNSTRMAERGLRFQDVDIFLPERRGLHSRLACWILGGDFFFSGGHPSSLSLLPSSCLPSFSRVRPSSYTRVIHDTRPRRATRYSRCLVPAIVTVFVTVIVVLALLLESSSIIVHGRDA